jgi:RNA polymerase sigma-70 factor, ECF subfamily
MAARRARKGTVRRARAAEAPAAKAPAPDLSEIPDLTVLLNRVSAGDLSAEDALARLLYDELRRQAHRAFADQPRNVSIQVTALVSETYAKLLRRRGMRWNDRRHFLGTAATAMKTILVDHARSRRRGKRKPRGSRVALDCLLDEYERCAQDMRLDIEDLSRALERLAAVDPRAAEVVHLRFFLGLPLPKVAQVTRTSLRTAERRWETAREFLKGELA